MLNPDLIEVISTVLVAAQDTPLQRRAKLYRGLARICGDPREVETLVSLAAELEAAHARCAAFEFTFMEKTSTETKP